MHDGSHDFELQRNRAVEFLDEDTRATFITRTYLHLATAVAAFIALEVALFKSGLVAPLFNLPPLALLGGFVVVSWGASHVAHRVQSLPLQYLALGIFVLAESIFFAPLLWYVSSYAPDVLTLAVFATLFAFAALTAVAFMTRKDFSFLGALLRFGFFVALILIGISLFTGFTLGLWFAVGMILFAGAAILYDTSNVIHHFPEDRYVAASLQLFSSVAMLFWYMIRALLAFGDD